MMIYSGDLTQMVLQAVLLFVFSIVIYAFSPFGIGFVIFSIIRGKNKSPGLRTVSFAFQIILSILGLIAGIVVAIFYSLSGMYYFYGYNWIGILAIILGIGFVFVIELGILIWQSFSLKKNPAKLR